VKPTGVIPLVTAFVIALVTLPLAAAQLPVQPVSLQYSAKLPATMWRVQQNGISKDRAAALVKKQYGGKILAIKEVQKSGRAMYRIKGLSEKSQVYVVYVDKQSGRISR